MAHMSKDFDAGDWTTLVQHGLKMSEKAWRLAHFSDKCDICLIQQR